MAGAHRHTGSHQKGRQLNLLYVGANYKFSNQVNTMKLLSIGFVIAALSTTAIAQTVAAPAGEKAPLATHSCAKPPLPDATKALTAQEANAFVKVLETFRNCVQAFSEGQKQIAITRQKEAEAFKLSAVSASTAAVAAAAAADAAVNDYNKYSDQAVKIVTPKDQGNAQRPVAIEPAGPRPSRGY
jgi:hypothetical protein